MSASGPNRANKKPRTNWRTPQAFFDTLNEEFHFTLDGAADQSNHLCSCYFSKRVSAFNCAPMGESIFTNPPYNEIGAWVDLFIEWGKHNTVVALLPNNTDTSWFVRAFATCSEVRFVYPRLSFVHPTTGNPAESPAGGNMVVVWDEGRTKFPKEVWPYTSIIGTDGRPL